MEQPSCDGISNGLNTFCGPGETIGEAITTAANNSAGGGGKGQRHYMRKDRVASGGFILYFSENQSEFWMRWYLRYDPAITWGPYVWNKLIYLEAGKPQGCYVSLDSNFKCYIHSNAEGTGWRTPEGYGWNYLGDGKFHCFELHLKMDTNGSDGVTQLWMDEDLVIDEHTVDWGTGTGWGSILLGSNHGSPLGDGVTNTDCMPQDFDDIEINNTGYIGPIGTTPPEPEPPVITPTVTNLTFSPDEIKDNMNWTAITTIQNHNDFPVENIRVGFYHSESPLNIIHIVDGITIPASTTIDLETTFEPWPANQYHLCAKVLGE